MKITTVGIVGAGLMGRGIAEVCAVSGYNVKLLDISSDALDESMRAISRELDDLTAKGRLDPGKAGSALERITAGDSYDLLRDCQVVIEAATEDEAVKKEVIKRVCAVLPAEGIITSNTSTLSITRLASQSDRPGRFLGTHFMVPVPKMDLVELIRGIASEEYTFRIIHDFAVSLGKTPVSAEDFPAFIVHRILMPMINEAIYTLYEGVGSVESIDKAMKLGTRHPMGPLELADFIGLDTCLNVMQALNDGLADPKYRPCPLLVKYVDAGWLGRKTRRGFYDYSGDEPRPTR